ncbi:nucleoside phosphorylase domain-containing protein [Lophiotrema nucula]|uniref:Nucleoside phosphorylase domain-containing protein n=1 Tax=Lophiotrema nucula TaxID=690887 RepID=A0A6A5ZEV4_9PLEO|nr:nucleoside phosphorylase domain-containing protein [Lophiotrema nucula]
MDEAEAAPRRDEFRVAVICAVGPEGRAVEKHFTKSWTVEEIGKDADDDNAYSLGCIGNTLVVLVWMGEYGKTAAATAAKDLRYSFKHIRYAFVVGICGGVPTVHEGKEILLGDVIISTGLQEYDRGKQYQDAYCPAGETTKTQKHMRAFLVKMGSSDDSKEELQTACADHLQRLLDKNDAYAAEARYPGWQEDLLYQPTYVHKHRDATECHFCANSTEQCSEARDKACPELQCGKSPEHFVLRRRLQDQSTPTCPSIHFGSVGSGDTVMKSGKHRDEIAAKGKVIAFEMEGAAVCSAFKSTLVSTEVIKGVCDYADSHKSKKWQKHAAATAAACTRAFLDKMRQEGYLVFSRPRRGSSSSFPTISTVSSSARSISSSFSELSLQSPVSSPSSMEHFRTSLRHQSIYSPPLAKVEKACKDVVVSVQIHSSKPGRTLVSWSYLQLLNGLLSTRVKRAIFKAFLLLLLGTISIRAILP